MAAASQPETPKDLLRAFLRADAPKREKLAMKVIAGACLGVIPLVLVMGPVQGWRLSLGLTAAMGVMALWCLGIHELLARGWYHPVLPLLNVYFEVTLPFAPILLFWWMRGPLNALTSPVYTAWGGLVVFSAFRSSPKICIGAGLLAACESALLYFIIGVPPHAGLETLAWPWWLQRSAFLFLSGVVGAGLARSQVRRAEDALRAVRAQDLLGKYFLHERLGIGGMAEVYLATYCPEGGFQKKVAIKRVLPELGTRRHFAELFLREARLCARLNHPNIVQVLDCGRYRDTLILAMEWVDGVSLHRLIGAFPGALPLAAVTYLGAELASGLDYLHHRIGEDGQPLGLIHRDVNPPNVLLSRFGEVKLADFGVAHAARSAEGKGFVGKVSYATPEQRDHHKLSSRTDLYALGLTLHEALTGRAVFSPDGDIDEPSLRLPEVLPPSRFRKEVPPALDALVMALLEPRPEARPMRGNEVRERLLALGGEAAPFPTGANRLAEVVEKALATAGAMRAASPSGDRTQPLTERITQELRVLR